MLSRKKDCDSFTLKLILRSSYKKADCVTLKLSLYFLSRWIITEWMTRWSLTCQDQHLNSGWICLSIIDREASSQRCHSVDLAGFRWFCKGTTSMNFIKDLREPKFVVLGYSHWISPYGRQGCVFDFGCDNMAVPKRRKIRTLALLFCILTFTTLLLSYTFRDPSMYFFKYAFRLSDTFFAKGSCTWRQCMTELEDDLWFAERFNQSIHPLMTRENSVLSDETFKWWQVAQSADEVLKKMAHECRTEITQCCSARCLFLPHWLFQIQGIFSGIKSWGKTPTHNLFTFNRQDGGSGFFVARNLSIYRRQETISIPFECIGDDARSHPLKPQHANTADTSFRRVLSTITVY